MVAIFSRGDELSSVISYDAISPTQMRYLYDLAYYELKHGESMAITVIYVYIYIHTYIYIIMVIDEARLISTLCRNTFNKLICIYIYIYIYLYIRGTHRHT